LGFIAEAAKVVLDVLVLPFGLAIGLRVESGAQAPRYL
jgi:hypothetical protein